MSDQERHNKTKTSLFFGLIFICFLAIWLFLTFNSIPGHGQLHSWLIRQLVSVNPLPNAFIDSHQESRKAIYVLGGSQESLKSRFKTAASLYHERVVRKIFILSRPGITEYDPLLERNLTNDAWSVKRLTGLGVQKEDIEPLSLKYGFFGTLNEAQEVSLEVTRRGYDILILISSSYHTARVRESFSKYFNDKEINLFIYGSDDSPPLLGLLIEYLKLIVYKNILLN